MMRVPIIAKTKKGANAVSEPTNKSYPASGVFAISMYPGEFLREAYLEPLRLIVDDDAQKLG